MTSERDANTVLGLVLSCLSVGLYSRNLLSPPSCVQCLYLFCISSVYLVRKLIVPCSFTRAAVARRSRAVSYCGLEHLDTRGWHAAWLVRMTAEFFTQGQGG